MARWYTSHGMYVVTNTLAFIALLGIATYFAFESVRAAAPTESGRPRDASYAIAAGLIVVMLITMAALLLAPSLLQPPQPPARFQKQWIARPPSRPGVRRDRTHQRATRLTPSAMPSRFRLGRSPISVNLRPCSRQLSEWNGG